MGNLLSRDLFPGALEMMILESLRRQPAHGYALVQHIHQRSNNLLQVEEGSLYPALQRLLKAKLVKAEWGVSSTNRRVRTYQITATGLHHLEQEISSFERMFEGISLVLNAQILCALRGASMNWKPKIFRRRRLYDDLSEEIQLHIEEHTEHLISEGMNPEEARRAACRAFGNRTLFEERSREVWQWPILESMAADVRLALRQLRRSPGFTLATVLTMALAIGANAVVFSVFNAFLLRPLNVPRPESLYALQRGDEALGYLSYPNYIDLRDRNRTFEGLAAFNAVMVGFDTGSNPSREWGEDVSGNYFDVLKLQPYLGRYFHASDERGPNSAPYIVLTYAFWHTRFQGDPQVVGREVRLNAHPFTVIGVSPPQFHGTLLFFNPSFFVPMIERPLLAGTDLNRRGESSVFESLGHLRPGVTPTQAIVDLNGIGVALQKSYPNDVSKMTFSLTRPSLYGDYLGRPVRAFMTGLLLLTGMILLAACANLGSLFAARASDRSRQVALRLALGSSRKRVLRGLFTEAILLSFVGGGVGLLVSIVLLRSLSAWQPIPAFPIHLEVNPDASVYLAAFLLALVGGILFGAVPVRQVLRTSPYEAMKAPVGAAIGKKISFREVLVVIQVAICGVLVTSSLVAVRGLERSLHAHFGFSLSNTLLAEMDLGAVGYGGDRVPAVQKRMVEAVQALGGVSSVALTDALPLSVDGGGDQLVFADNVSDLRPSNASGKARTYNVSPEYFRAAGTSLLSGRGFTEHDDKAAPRVAIVNLEFARKLYGSTTKAIGNRYKLKSGASIQVVGIAEDGKYDSLTESPKPAMFFPILQSPSTSTILVIRSTPTANQDELASSIRSTLTQLERGLPIIVETRDKPLDSILFGPRVATIALGVLGFIGLALSITGLFGIAAYSVSKRLKEFGIRIALGAQRRQVLETALGRALKLLTVGSAAGVLLGIFATRVLAYLVYQATPRDPVVLAGVITAMALLGLVATWLPARRAQSASPSTLLHDD